MRAMPTTHREPWEDERYPATPYGYTDADIARAAGRSREAVSLLRRNAEQKFRRVWNLWARVNFDERRKSEIERLLP